MAKTNQDWYFGKGLFNFYSDICKSRNHTLKSLSGLDDKSGRIGAGTITFVCYNCNLEITTTVNAYRAVKSTSTTNSGCRNCKSIAAKEREALKRANNPPRMTRQRRRFWTKTSPLKTREAIVEHLRSETNPHNSRVLELMQRDPPTDQGKLYKHHIIPCFAGGEERKYNEILVTELEHWEVHLLR